VLSEAVSRVRERVTEKHMGEGGQPPPASPTAADLVLISMHEGVQSANATAKSAMQSVTYWSLAAGAAVLAIQVSLIGASPPEGTIHGPGLPSLAIRLGEIAWPLIVLLGGTFWLVEMGRMKRAATIALRIECALRSRHSSLDLAVLPQHAVVTAGKDGPTREMRLPFLLMAVVVLGGVLLLQVLQTWVVPEAIMSLRVPRWEKWLVLGGMILEVGSLVVLARVLLNRHQPICQCVSDSASLATSALRGQT